MSWSAKQYVTFEQQRNRPIHDLLAALPPTPARAVMDLGCGPGNSTELLAARYPDAAVSALDNSPDILEATAQRLPGIHFELADITSWQGCGSYDVILSNAVLQWVPDHATLLPALMARLAPGGSLAIQMPDNLDEPAHQLMRGIAADGAWTQALAGAAQARHARHDAPWYYSALLPLCTRLDVWRTEYYHRLAGGAPDIVEWFKGSGLRPFLDRLDEPDQAAFLARYTQAVA